MRAKDGPTPINCSLIHSSTVLRLMRIPADLSAIPPFLTLVCLPTIHTPVQPKGTYQATRGGLCPTPTLAASFPAPSPSYNPHLYRRPVVPAAIFAGVPSK